MLAADPACEQNKSDHVNVYRESELIDHLRSALFRNISLLFRFYGTFSSSVDEALDFSNSSEEEESLCFAFRLGGTDLTGSTLSETFLAESIAFFLAI